MDWKDCVSVIIFLCGILFLGLFIVTDEFWIKLFNLCIGVIDISFAMGFFFMVNNNDYLQ